MNKTALILLALALVAFITNPDQVEHQQKANELFEQRLNAEADSGNLLAKVAQSFGAGKAGGLVLRVERENYFLLSTGRVYSTIDNQEIGLLLGLFGQVFLINAQPIEPALSLEINNHD